MWLSSVKLFTSCIFACNESKWWPRGLHWFSLCIKICFIHLYKSIVKYASKIAELMFLSHLSYIHRLVTGVFHCPLFKHKHHPFSDRPDNRGLNSWISVKVRVNWVEQYIYIKSISICYGVIHHWSFTRLFMHVIRRVCFKGLVNIGLNICCIINHSQSKSQITLGWVMRSGRILTRKTDCFGPELWICLYFVLQKMTVDVLIVMLMIKIDNINSSLFDTKYCSQMWLTGIFFFY